MSDNSNKPNSEISQAVVYQIRIKGHLGNEWSDWFGDLSITLEDDGDTVLTGLVVDQAALHGLLKKVRNAGMPLLSINSVQLDQANASDFKQSLEKSDFFNDFQQNEKKEVQDDK